jgi:hypothetical protein
MTAAALASALLAPAAVQAEEAAGPNTGNISLSAGIDFTSQYIFRGIPQQNAGLIAQPYANIGFKVYEGEGAVNNVTINTGVWSSFQEENRPNHYETDFTLGVSATLFEKWTASATYIWYTYQSLVDVQELDIKLAYNDAGLWPEIGGQQVSLQPYVLIAFETQNQADLGGTNDYGTYLELGISPSYVVEVSKEYPLTLSLPVTLGLSLSDYYQTSPTTGDDTFGFFSVGLKGAIPLAFIPSSYGAWTFTAGVTCIWLGDDAALIGNINGVSGTGDFDVVVTLGIGFVY